MKKTTLLIFLVSSPLVGQWVNQPSDTLIREYGTVFMLDGQTGWIGGNYGSILKTTDGGGSWFVQRSTSSQFDDVIQIIFADKSRGYCLAATDGYPSLFTTTDGGSAWLVDSSLFNLVSDSSVSPIQFSVIKSGDSVLVSVYCLRLSGSGPFHADVFNSTDFGKTWSLGHNPPVGNQIMSAPTFLSLWTEVVLSQKSLFRSTDRGNTWQQDSLNFNASLLSFSFLNRDTGYFAGPLSLTSPSPSLIGWTYDGGATWTIDTTTLLEDLTIYTVFFTSTQKGFATKWNVASIFSTSDGGKTWKESQLSNGIPPADVCSADGQTVVVAGAGGEIIVSKDSGATWTDLTPPQKIYFSSVRYLSGDLVAAIGNNIGLFISNDSCKHWTMHTLASGLNPVIAFGDTLNCWIGDDSSRIYHSSDLGITWTFQNEHNIPAPPLYGIHFLNDSIGCAVGATGYITATTNGGTTWTTTSSSSHNLYGVFVASRTRAWAVGDAGTIITTSNTFSSWTSQSSPTSAPLRTVSFSDTLNGYILGDNGTVLKTTDGGTTWSLAQSPGSTLNAMKFISANEGWVVGDSGKIFTTNTGGAQWESQTSGVTANLLSVDFLDAHNGITIGNGGIVLTTKNGGLTGVRDPHGSFPTSVTLDQNYPNPFNPATTISFAIPSRSRVSLTIFDVLGRQVSTIVSEELQAGSYTRQWNAANMASGVYFYRLQAGSFTETRKLLLLK